MPLASSRARNTPVFSTRLGRIAAALAAAVLAIVAATLGLSAPAHAASMIGDAITNVTVTPNDPEQGGQLTTGIDWKVPDGTQEGDQFTLTLSSHLKNLPVGFALVDPATKAIVANAVLSDTNPAVITFTMTAFASTHYEVHGTAFVTSNFDAVSTPSGVSTPFTSVTNDGKSFTTPVTPTGEVGDNEIPNKWGDYTRVDQGRTDPSAFLFYTIVTPEGPSDTSRITDTVPAGQDWTFDCDSLTAQDGTLGANDLVSSYSDAVGSSIVSCDTHSFTVDFGAQVARHVNAVQFTVSLPEATGVDTAPQTFLNQADVSWTTGGATQTATTYASNEQASAGGTGVGTNPVAAVSITKGDSLGNAADTAATEATLPASGTASLVYTVTNTGTDALQNVSVADQVLANGDVTGLTCDFSSLGGPAGGSTSYAGHFAVGASFPCTAQLSGVTQAGGDHHDVGTVTATGVLSGTAVTASNDYYAVVTSQPAGGTTGGNGTTGGTGGNGGGTTGSPAGGDSGPAGTGSTTVTAPIAPAADTTTPVSDSSASGQLAYTGTNVVAPLELAAILFGLGAVLTVLSITRRRRLATGDAAQRD